jgi:hypothetical protein
MPGDFFSLIAQPAPESSGVRETLYCRGRVPEQYSMNLKGWIE